MWRLKHNPVLKFRLAIQLRSLLYSDASGRLIARLFRDRLSNYGRKIDTNTPYISPSMKAKIWFGAYERAEVMFVKKFLQAEQDVIELGSSIGVVSSHIATALSPGHRLICVEANENLLPIIHRNIELNAPKAEVELIHAAIDYSGSAHVDFVIGTQNTESKIAHGANNAVRVRSMTLEEVCSLCGISGPFSLVMDIEGAEFNLLKAEFDTLSMCSLLITELHTATVYHEGQQSVVTPNKMAEMIMGRHGFKQISRWGNVFAFQKV